MFTLVYVWMVGWLAHPAPQCCSGLTGTTTTKKWTTFETKCESLGLVYRHARVTHRGVYRLYTFRVFFPLSHLFVYYFASSNAPPTPPTRSHFCNLNLRRLLNFWGILNFLFLSHFSYLFLLSLILSHLISSHREYLVMAMHNNDPYIDIATR